MKPIFERFGVQDNHGEVRSKRRSMSWVLFATVCFQPASAYAAACAPGVRTPCTIGLAQLVSALAVTCNRWDPQEAATASIQSCDRQFDAQERAKAAACATLGGNCWCMGAMSYPMNRVPTPGVTGQFTTSRTGAFQCWDAPGPQCGGQCRTVP